MGSNPNNNSVIFLIVIVTMLLANAREATSKVPPHDVPPMEPPIRPPTPPLPTSPPPPTPPSRHPPPTSPPVPPPPHPPPPSPPRTQTNTSLGKPKPKIGRHYFRLPNIVTGNIYCNCPRCGRPLRGARVQLSCRIGRFITQKITMITSSSGRFYGTLPWWWANPSKCKVTFQYAPSYCRLKTNLNGGLSGARLRREYQNIYAVGPFSSTTSPRIRCR